MIFHNKIFRTKKPFIKKMHHIHTNILQLCIQLKTYILQLEQSEFERRE